KTYTLVSTERYRFDRTALHLESPFVQTKLYHPLAKKLSKKIVSGYCQTLPGVVYSSPLPLEATRNLKKEYSA
ncbi:MAG: hypothetical protein AB7D26_12435, partial [Marinobacterium sp.]